MEYSQCGRCAELGNDGVPVTTLIKIEPREEFWPDLNDHPPLMGQLCDEHAAEVRVYFEKYRDLLWLIEDAPITA